MSEQEITRENEGAINLQRQLDTARAKLKQFADAGKLTPDSGKMTTKEVRERFGPDVKYHGIDAIELVDTETTNGFSGSLEFNREQESA